jgi:hypothetical protein
MIRRILLAYDGSTGADRALDFALDLALKYAAELHVLAVARPPEFGDDVESRAVIENARWHYDRALGPVKIRLAGETIKTTFMSRSVTRPNRSCATPRNTRSITSWSATAATRCSSAG